MNYLTEQFDRIVGGDISEGWKEDKKAERAEKMKELKAKYGADIKKLKSELKKVLGYMPSISSGTAGLKIKFKVHYRELPIDFMGMTEKVAPSRDRWSKGIADSGKSMMLKYEMLAPLVKLVSKSK